MRAGRTLVAAAVGVVAFVVLWEGYKLIGSPDGTVVFGVRILPRADDLSMPHLYDIVGRLARPELAGGRPIWVVVLQAAAFTLGITAVGFAVGTLVGLLLAVAMQRFLIVERGLLPYVILSQTVPLVALAPLVAGWSGALTFGPYAWQDWMTVAVIAAYLAFFPVAVGMLRGLQSPPAAGVELMHSYAAGWWRTLVKLRLPASLPYLFTALKISATAGIVGAIIGEGPGGISDGLGRIIITFNQYYITGPEKLWAAILFTALLGIVFFLCVRAVEIVVLRGRPGAVAG
jgi:NitT/TauT family transport system permease protein